MPLIPWIEPKLGGRRTGQLIHPTSNPKSLGKAYSNGCIGTREADAWRIYYHAPLGTRVVVRYDLRVADTIRLKDIYNDKLTKVDD
jgi:L,D-transpeptidase ErfK/SrfK